MRFQGRSYSDGGDVIVSFGGVPVRSEDDLARLVAERRAGERVELRLLRGGGEQKTVTVTLGQRPIGDPPKG